LKHYAAPAFREAARGAFDPMKSDNRPPASGSREPAGTGLRELDASIGQQDPYERKLG